LPGAFFLAIKAQVDIVPIALIGMYDLLPMNTYHIKSQPLKVKFGAPISTASLSLRDTEALSEKVRNSMLQLFHSTSSLQTD
jgi:1-acyl-sn-glycerol-3-phosphate acyltransferase